TAAGVIVLRFKRPDAPRPFRCPLVPIVPGLFIAVVLAVDVLTLASPNDRSNALIGLAILGAGVPVYFVLRRGRRREAARAGPGRSGPPRREASPADRLRRGGSRDGTRERSVAAREAAGRSVALRFDPRRLPRTAAPHGRPASRSAAARAARRLRR